MCTRLRPTPRAFCNLLLLRLLAKSRFLFKSRSKRDPCLRQTLPVPGPIECREMVYRWNSLLKCLPGWWPASI